MGISFLKTYLKLILATKDNGISDHTKTSVFYLFLLRHKSAQYFTYQVV